MSDRRLHILHLMAQRQQRDMGKVSARISALRQDELQQFDLVDRIDGLLGQMATSDLQPVSRSGLMTRQFMQQAMVTQRGTAQARLDDLRAACRQQIATLGTHQQRKSVLDDHANTIRRMMTETKATEEDQSSSRPKPRR